MASELSAHDNRLAHRSGNQSGDLERGLFHTVIRTFVPSGGRVRDRHPSTSQEAGEVRPISILAGLLRPFAGNDSGALAKHLIERFGTIHRLLTASDEQICAACEGHIDVGSRISGARALILAGMQEAVERSPVDPADPNLKRYLTVKFRGRPHEELHAIFVDHEQGFIAVELVSVGNVRRVDVRIGTILRRAIELGACGLFLVHNHPSEVPEPSRDDIRATRQFKMVASALDITVLDHLIIAGNKVVSMRGLNLL